MKMNLKIKVIIASAFIIASICYYKIYSFQNLKIGQQSGSVKNKIWPDQLADGMALVTIPGRHYQMMKYDVTFDLWDLCIQEGACRGYYPGEEVWGKGKRPVVNVDYEDAQMFARWVSQYTGKAFRLPTEDEWEYAARGGTSTLYWWGNNIDCTKANYGQKPNHVCLVNDHFAGSSDVTSFPPNPYGLYDMSGNVWQWTSTCADADCQQRVLRGGSWIDAARFLQISFRGRNWANTHLPVYGFRLVLDNELR